MWGQCRRAVMWGYVMRQCCIIFVCRDSFETIPTIFRYLSSQRIQFPSCIPFVNASLLRPFSYVDFEPIKEFLHRHSIGKMGFLHPLDFSFILNGLEQADRRVSLYYFGLQCIFLKHLIEIV